MNEDPPGFRATFLGHQGWLISSARSCLLLDPLLTDHFGHGGLLGVPYPPRTLDLAAFPPIDGVIISHEHDDHFDLPSLARLDRRVPLWLSSRSSAAAFDVLRALGFCSIHALEPQSTTAIGDLRVHTFVGDHRATAGDEWDACPLLIHDLHGHGSLASTVDLAPAPDLWTRMAAVGVAPGIWAHANNSSRAAFQTIDLAGSAGARAPTILGEDDPSDTALLTRVLRRRLAQIEAQWGTPAVAAICGGGWSLPGERAWMNQHLFPIDGAQLAAALRASLGDGPGPHPCAPAPGDTLHLRRGRLVADEPPAAFITALPRARWPSREFLGDGARLHDYAPACGARHLDAEAEAQLIAALDELARFLFAGPIFRALHSLPPRLDDGREAALCLRLRRAEQGDLILIYEPSGCCFRARACDDPLATFAAGLECWATDLLALLAGELAPSALCYAGRMRVWNAAPRLLRVSPQLLWTFAHPLHSPHRARRLYARLRAALTPVPVAMQVPARL